MASSRYDLRVEAGSPYSKAFRYLQFTPDPGTGVREPVDMTDWTARAQVRTNAKASSAVIDVDPVIDVATGTISLAFTGEQTSLLTATGYIWALELYGSTGITKGELLKGSVLVAPEVVR